LYMLCKGQTAWDLPAATEMSGLSAKADRRVELRIAEGQCQIQGWPDFRKNIVQLKSLS